MIVLIDNGHGLETPGKRSPDGRLKEAAYTRMLAHNLQQRLQGIGIESRLLVPEQTDISLHERCRRANRLALHNKCILISLHVNAAGCSGFHSASGWSAFVAPGASAASRLLARNLHISAVAHGLTGNRRTPPDGFWTASLAICRDTSCPAVLTENMFMDNRKDLEFLLSEQGCRILTEVHTDGITGFLSRL